MDNDEEFLIILGIVIALIALVLLVYIFFLLTLQRALGRCRPQNRTMEPGLVWLNLIPFFNIVWQFVTVSKVATSLNNEFRTRGRHRRDEDYGLTIGMVSCGLNLAGVIPLLGILCALGGFVCWIIYWGRIAGFGAQLASTPAHDYTDEDDAFDEDERGNQRDRNDREPPAAERPWDKGGR